MRILAAFHRLKRTAPTGGELYDRRLYEAIGQDCDVVPTNVRYRWFVLRVHVFIWLLCFKEKARRADWICQAASGGERSALLVRLTRKLWPTVRHLGIVHHPRWLEDPRARQKEVKFYNRFDRLLVISDHIAALLREAGVTVPLSILRPGCSRPLLAGVAKERPPLILWNGHLLARKGPQVLLEALGQLPSSVPHRIEFIAATQTDAAFTARFQKGLAKLNQQGSPAVLRGRLDREDFERRLASAEIFCLPSEVEGYSIATVEAMAAGCVVILPRTANFVELLGSEAYEGFFPPGDSDALANLLHILLASPELRTRLRSICEARAAELPTWDTFAADARIFCRRQLISHE